MRRFRPTEIAAFVLTLALIGALGWAGDLSVDGQVIGICESRGESRV